MDNRELDARVAEHVMGYVEVIAPVRDGLTRTDTFGGDTFADAEARLIGAYPASKESGVLWPAYYCGPAYSTDPTAMMEVVERMEADGWDWCFQTVGPVKEAIFVHGDHPGDTVARAPTLMEAVAIAALRACGVDVMP